MRISLLTFPYSPMPTGGVSVVYEYANRLAQRGHAVHVIHGGPTEDVRRRFGWALPGPATAPSHSWFEHEPRVVLRHVPQHSPATLPPGDILIQGLPLLPAFPRGRGTPISLLQGIGVFQDEVDQSQLSASIRKVCVSNWLRDLARQAGTREQDIAYVPNGIDHAIFRVVHPIASRSPCIAMLWHPHYIKGSDIGLAALELARARFPMLRVILFGAWPPLRVLPDWIEYVENPSRQRLVEDVYNQASLFLSPSRMEGFSFCAIEAMACGCTLVGTDVPGMRDYAKHETTALLSPVNDAAALAANACRLLEDEAQRCALAEAGRLKSLQFDWNRTIDLLEESLVRFREADLTR